MTEYKVEHVTDPVTLGEGPHWDVETQKLYFVDIRKGSINSYNPANGKFSTAVIGKGDKPVTLIVPVAGAKGKSFLISIKNDLYRVSWDGDSSSTSEPEFIASVEHPDNTHRLNDGKADPKGRLWAGTMGQEIEVNGKKIFEPEVGALYTLEKDKSVALKQNKITISNGLTWQLDKKKFYFIDSGRYRVESYDYDNESGNISNCKIIFDFAKNSITGLPDGMTIDCDGKLYVACYGGSEVLKIDPESGKLISRIPIPTPEVTSVAFGGSNLDELYVTTANVVYFELNDTNAGRLFKVTNMGAKGEPAVNVCL